MPGFVFILFWIGIVALLEYASHVARLGDVGLLTDDALLTAQRSVALLTREVDAIAARVSAEVSRRSSRELGHAGLAARKGFRSPVELVAHVAGISKSSAAKLVAVADSPAVASVGLDAVDAVNRGLGKPDAAVTSVQLDHARRQLLASRLLPDELFRRARQMRDELDATAIERREKQQLDLRYWKHSRRADGMVAGSYLLTPEAGALLSSAFQTLMSPRRGGPRFVDAPVVRSEDSRTDEQFAADGLVAMIHVAVNADAGRVFPSKKPAVRVIVREIDLATGAGHGVLEDSGHPVSLGTVKRYACESGLLGLRFDATGQVLDIGRTQRLHTVQQRVAIAVRDGGCMAPGCRVPVSMTEVHHPNHWDRDAGATSVDNGISLCRFHHMNLHSNGAEMQIVDGVFWMIPPDADPEQVPVRLQSKNPLLAESKPLARSG